MKKLLIGALCIMSACQSKTNQKQLSISSKAGTSNTILSDDIDNDTRTAKWKDTIVHDVWVADYHKQLFRVGYAAINSNYCDNWFMCDKPNSGCGDYYAVDVSARQPKEYCKFISKPIPLHEIDHMKAILYKKVIAAMDSIGYDKRKKKLLDSIAKSMAK